MSRTSPLDAQHRRLGAKMVDFGGWSMPLSYPAGTVAEHRACRSGVALFDVSHLGTVRLLGPEAFDILQGGLSNDLGRIAPGRTQYSHLLDPADGSVVDDVLVWWVAPERFDVMPNASNTARVRQALGGDDVTADRAVLAVQGPAARRAVAAVEPAAAVVGRSRVAEVSGRFGTVVVAGTGYTGEDGVELAVGADAAPALWDALVEAGAVPAGLGARDTLRLEAGLPLHGHELGPGITPLQAGLSWVVGWDKADFAGKAALVAERERGPRRVLRGLRLEGRRPPREGQAVLARGRTVGQVTSGNFSPILERGIGLALLDPQVVAGQPVEVDLRGTQAPAVVVDPPFVRRTRAGGTRP